MDFIKNLSMHYNALPKQSRRLADFIRENPSKVIRMTAKALGEESGTSAAAVVRLCQQLGFEGLEQMKISLARYVSSEELNIPIDPIIAPGDSIPDIAQKLCHMQTTTVQETLALMDYDAVKKAVCLLQKARRVYLFGLGSSGLVAQELCHRLNRIGIPCIFLSDGHTNLEYAAVADGKDLVIAFSYSGETREVYLAARHARERGTEVIAVTRDKLSTLTDSASLVLRVPIAENRVRVGAMASIDSEMFVANVLYMSLLQKDFEKYEKMFIDTSRVVNLLRE